MEENTTNIIVAATSDDRDEILRLYKLQLGREYCPWDEHYPGTGEIDYDPVSYTHLTLPTTGLV